MATLLTTTGKRLVLTIEQKARCLQVIDVNEPGILAVRSASDPRIAYAVYHNGHNVTGCACTGCKQYGRKQCAYRLAASWKLQADRRAAYVETFHIYD